MGFTSPLSQLVVIADIYGSQYDRVAWLDLRNDIPCGGFLSTEEVRRGDIFDVLVLE